MEPLSIGDLARATGLTVRALRHYQDWTPVEIVLPVAAEAVTLAFGVLLAGDGVLWADDLGFDALPA